MSEHYSLLLDAAIGHLESLKKEGLRFVSVQPENLARLQSKPQPTAAKPKIQPQPEIKLEKVETPEPARIISPPVVEEKPKAKVEQKPAAPITGKLPKPEAIQALRKKVEACLKCPKLVAARKNVVFGVGTIDAQLMFVGEAPGADEDLQGEPFVGAAGQLLTKMIQAMGLSRETVYIANILKCRPDMPGQASGNRKPTPAEMQTCIPYLREQIDLIGPKVIVALGATAVEGLLGKTEGITRLRGNFQVFSGIPVMPTYHPAYLLRNQAVSEKRKVWEDMLKVMEKLQLPISDKQRGYFLSQK